MKAFGISGQSNLGGIAEHPRTAEEKREELEESLDRNKAQRKMLAAPVDPIGAAIKSKGYTENKLFAALYRGATVCVSRFYSDQNAAVDIFEDGISGTEKTEIEFKRAMFKNTKIRYAALEPKTEMASLLEQLGV